MTLGNQPYTPSDEEIKNSNLDTSKIFSFEEGERQLANFFQKDSKEIGKLLAKLKEKSNQIKFKDSRRQKDTGRELVIFELLDSKNDIIKTIIIGHSDETKTNLSYRSTAVEIF